MLSLLTELLLDLLSIRNQNHKAVTSSTSSGVKLKLADPLSGAHIAAQHPLLENLLLEARALR